MGVVRKRRGGNVYRNNSDGDQLGDEEVHEFHHGLSQENEGGDPESEDHGDQEFPADVSIYNLHGCLLPGYKIS